jgi:hypothetical protein
MEGSKMSDRIISVCNGCGKRTDDYYVENDWIKIEAYLSGGFAITITHGRDKTNNNQALTDYQVYDSEDESLHFCCYECLIKYLKDLGNK